MGGVFPKDDKMRGTLFGNYFKKPTAKPLKFRR
jgi:hypothetical protein